MGHESTIEKAASSGVKVVGLQGRLGIQRERLLGMTEAERAWRAQWLKDQILHDEPINMTPTYYKARYNIFRRIYRIPMNGFEAVLRPVLGAKGAFNTRFCVSKFAITILGVYLTYYHFKYNKSDWTNWAGWKITWSSTASYPGDPDYPCIKDKKPHEYASFGFENSPI